MPTARPQTPADRARDLRKQVQATEKEPSSPERAERLARLARLAHADRNLNMAMHVAALSLEDDPDPPAMLVEAYTPPPGTEPDEGLRIWADLQDLARYLGRDDLHAEASARINAAATDWIADADESETRHRLRSLTSIFDRAFADNIRDALT